MPELTRRYIVMAMAAESPFDVYDPEAPFVLKPWKDPAALHALEAYRDRCYPELAADLTGWIGAIRTGVRVRGGVGARNEAHITAHGKVRPGPTRPRPVPKAKARVKTKSTGRKPLKKKGKRC